MNGRWIFREEFQLLLRVAEFSRWACYGSPERDPLIIGMNDVHSYWIAYK